MEAICSFHISVISFLFLLAAYMFKYTAFLRILFIFFFAEGGVGAGQHTIHTARQNAFDGHTGRQFAEYVVEAALWRGSRQNFCALPQLNACVGAETVE